MLAIAAALVIRYVEQERLRLEGQARDDARLLGLTIEREIGHVIRAAQMLAVSSGRLREGDMQGMHRQLLEAMRLGHDEVSLSDQEGRQLLNAHRPVGEPLPPLADRDRAKRALQRGIHVSGLTTSAANGRPMVAVDIRVDGTPDGPRVLSFGMALDRLQALLSQQDVPSDWIAAVVDEEGIILARNRSPDLHVGQAATTAFRAMLDQEAGRYSTRSRDGIDVEGFYRRLPQSGWVVVVGVPRAAFTSLLRDSIGIFLAGGLALMAVAALIVWAAARRIAEPLTALAASTRSLGAGAPPQLPPSGLREATAIGLAMRDAYANMQATERRVQMADAELTATLDVAGVGTWSIDLEQGTWHWNVNCGRLFGLPPGEWDQQPSYERSLRPADRSVLAGAVERLRAGDSPISAEFRIVWPDDSLHWLRIRGGETRHEDGTLLCRGVVINIDQLKAREEELRESEDRYRAIVETAIDSMVVIDERGIVRSFNRAAERAFGYDRGEVIGRNVKILMPAGHRERHDGYLERYNRTGEARIIGIGREVEAARKDGSLFPVNLSITEWWADGKRFFTGTLYDLTASKQEEEARTHLEAQLSQSQKMEAVGQLTGGIAHDFNNLLLAISLNLDSLDEAVPPGTDTGELIEGARSATEQARTLIAQLLAFGRRQTLSPTTFDANQSILAQRTLLRRTLEASIAIETVLAGDLWPAFADRHQFETALLNLSINARDAMPGGGRLLIETLNARLDADYAALNPDATVGDYVLVAVTDTGTGMAAAVVARAFEPFFTTKSVGQGSGLGLSQVYGYIKQSGGHVRIYSEPGHGTSVKLYLPRSTAMGQLDDGERRPVSVATGTETILMVEDTMAVRIAVKRTLRRLGYDVIDVATGADAVALLESDRHIDLLFTDMVLPGGMLGNDLAARARALRPGLKILLTSGYTQARLDLGNGEDALPLLFKPYTREELATRLRLLLTPSDAPDPSHAGAA